MLPPCSVFQPPPRLLLFDPGVTHLRGPARDLVDLFFIKKETEIALSFPKRECEVIENSFNERLQDIEKTKKEDLFIFQTIKQVDDLPYKEFEKFKRWLHDWLSRFC